MSNEIKTKNDLDEQFDNVLRLLEIVGVWKDVINYSVEQNLNPDTVLELLKHSVYVADKINGK